MWRLLALVALVGCPASQTPPPATPMPPPTPPPIPVAVVPTPIAPIPPTPGDDIPKLRLPRLFVPASYAARLAIDPDKTTFDGHIEISGALSTASSVIWLHGRHLSVRRATADGGAGLIALRVTPRGDDLLELTSEAALPPGPYKLALDYSGEVDTINTTGAFVESTDKLKYVFSQFEAIYARRVFPCLDEPDSKVPWQLTLDVPKGQIAVSNTAAITGPNARVATTSATSTRRSVRDAVRVGGRAERPSSSGPINSPVTAATSRKTSVRAPE